MEEGRRITEVGCVWPYLSIQQRLYFCVMCSSVPVEEVEEAEENRTEEGSECIAAKAWSFGT